MKLSVLVVFIVVPMLASIGLYTYAFISTRWSYLDEDFIHGHSSIEAKHHPRFERQLIRYGFRSYYALFGYCIDYKWLHLFTMKSSMSIDDQTQQINSTSTCPHCESSALTCPQTGCCVCKNESNPIKYVFLLSSDEYVRYDARLSIVYR